MPSDKPSPLVLDADYGSGHGIIDGNHRARMAVDRGDKTVPALVGVRHDLQEWSEAARLRSAEVRRERAHGRRALEDRVVGAAHSGGGTLPPGGGPEPNDGHAVAFDPKHSSVTPVDDFFAGPKGKEKGRAVFRKWLADNKDVLAGENVHVGVWRDDEHGEIVLDPSEVVADRAEALRKGRERDQQAVYDLKAGREIPTGGTGGRTEEAYTDERGTDQEQAAVGDGQAAPV